MNIEDVFTRLGLKKHSHDVYMYIRTAKAPALVTHIAQHLAISRAQVYRVLIDLLDKGFVTRVPVGGRTYYQGEEMSRVTKEFTKVSTQVADRVAKAAKSQAQDIPSHVVYLHGATGIRQAFDDAIDKSPKGSTFMRYTSEKDLISVNKYLSPLYRIKRDKKKLERLVISNPGSSKQKRSRLERFIKILSPQEGVFEQNIIQLIYANRVSFINLNTEKVIIIEDQSLADFQRVIFTQLYKKL